MNRVVPLWSQRTGTCSKGDPVQTTLLGLSIAFIVALIAALIGPYFIDWNQFRPQFETEATRVVGAPVRVGGELNARLLPTPSLRLRSVVVGGANDLGIDSQGRIDWPASSGKFNLGSVAIDRLNLTGRIALHDAGSRGTLELNDIAFGGDVRSLAGSLRGDGNFMLAGVRYPFRVSSGQSADGNATRVHLNIDPGARALSVDLDGTLAFEARAPRFEGAIVLAVPPGLKADGDVPITPWRITARVKADPAAARLEQVEASYGTEESALKFAGTGEMRFGQSPLLRAALSARQLDADRFVARDNNAAHPVRVFPAFRALMSRIPQPPIAAQLELNSDQVMLGGRPLQDVAAELHTDSKSWTVRRLDFRAPGGTRVSLGGSGAQATPSAAFHAAPPAASSHPHTLPASLQGRTDITYRSQKPLRLRGDVSVASDRIAIEPMKAEIDGGAVEGRIVVSHQPSRSGS